MLFRTRACVRDIQEGLQDASVFQWGDRREARSNVADQSTRSPNRACASSSVVSLVWVPRARPQTYHFFGDSRRGNILVLVLVLVLASSPRHHELNKVLARSSVPKSSLDTRYLLVSSLRSVLPSFILHVSFIFYYSLLYSIREFHTSRSFIYAFVDFLSGVSRAFRVRYSILSFFLFFFFFWVSVSSSVFGSKILEISSEVTKFLFLEIFIPSIK